MSVDVSSSIEWATSTLTPEEKVFIIGGGEVYRQFMPLAKELHITHIHHTWEDADTFFPEIDTSIWQQLNEEFHEADEKHAYAFTFATYVRK